MKEFEKMLEKEEDTGKTMFGNYKSLNLYQLDKLIQKYQKDNLFLTEAAQIILQNIKYEIPNLTKTMKKAQKQMIETERKETQNKKEANNHLQQYKNRCKELEIEGKDVEKELKEMADTKLPSLYLQVVEILQRDSLIENCLAFYKSFIDYNSNPQVSVDTSLVCVFLARVLKFGNEEIVDEVDFSDVVVSSTHEKNNQGTNWDIKLESNDENISSINDSSINDNQKINWDIKLETVENNIENTFVFNDNPSINDNQKINWDIKLEDELVNQNNSQKINWDIQMVGGDNMEDVVHVLDFGVKAKKNTRATLLSDPKFRRNFVNDLKELDAFLQQRKKELSVSQSNDMLSLSLSQMTPLSILKVDETQIDIWTDAIQQTLDSLFSKKMKEILGIQSSEHFLKRTVSTIQNELQLSIQLENTHSHFKNKKKELMNILQDTQPKIKFLENQAKEYVSLSEKALSLKMEGRKVFISLTAN
eukprot:TRINITY_DN4500_c0_g1_i1.p1 TRINITY_DN4500_c0_g1~~TRINITY_DN4500_c0_g1_i1.p1  ORF type:complete len:549 (-),score=203.36 TRINITY_DN4500_c0_g1_i1:17-1444(-)